MSTTKTDYMRLYKRERKGKPWLNDIEVEAAKRGLTLKAAVDLLLEEVTSRKMVGTLLDRQL